MDTILALILSCSLHYDDALVSAFVQRVSDGNIYFVGDLATATSYDHITSLPEALALVADIQKHGGRPAVGLMALPVTWAARYGRSTAELFDGCINISVGTDAMATFAAACAGPSTRPHLRSKTRRRRRLPAAANRACILRHFDTELGVHGYPEGVLAQLAKMAAKASDPGVDSPPARSSAFPDNTDETDARDRTDWSNPRLYFSSPPAPSPAR
jgi:hypothetical protein